MSDWADELAEEVYDYYETANFPEAANILRKWQQRIRLEALTEEAKWWHMRVAMAHFGENPNDECKERVAEHEAKLAALERKP